MCKHIAIVLPNRPGQFHEVTSLLSDIGVNVMGYTLSSEGRSGLLYLLCSPHDRAFRTLQAKYSFYCTEKEVVVAEVQNTPGALNAILRIIEEEEMNLPTSYQALSGRDTALIVMEFDSMEDTTRALRLLKESNVVVWSHIPV